MITPLSVEKLSSLFRTSPNDVSKIVNREGTSIEFKESYSHGSMSQYFKTMAAFANNNGGYIIFGVGDHPRRLIGLQGKSYSQFEDLKVEVFTNALSDYFSPEIRWEHCTFEFRENCFGVIYVYPLTRKPCICKKHYDSQNTKYALKEGDIYYRYGGRSERIKYTELAAIIDESRKEEEKQWIDFAKKAAKIGVANACLLDLQSGQISGGNSSILLDENLLEKIAFIKQGEFVETKGKPTLRLVGDIREISTGKIIVHETTKKVVRAIEASDIVKAFLFNQSVEEPLEYIKAICSATSANYPIYFLLRQSKIEITVAIELIKNTTSRGPIKKRLLARLSGSKIEAKKNPDTKTRSGLEKSEYLKSWLEESIPTEIPNLSYCLDALFCLTSAEITNHEEYIRKVLLNVYQSSYENVSSPLASTIRKTICRVDEAINTDEDVCNPKV